MQKTNGELVNGLCAIEWQEWIRLRAYPAMQETANMLFCKDSEWFSQTLYEELVTATRHSGANKKFLVSHDQDGRHSYYHHTTDPALLKHGGAKASREGKVDRRDLPPGRLHIPLIPVADYVPIAMKVPDCVQSPVEMFFATVKRHFRGKLSEYRAANVASGKACPPGVVADIALQSFANAGTPELVRSCWEHARKSLLVWTTPIGEWVQIGSFHVQGSGGNWVHKKYRG